MKLARFLLDQWLQEPGGPQVEFNLGSSTGPHWKLGELLELTGGEFLKTWTQRAAPSVAAT